MLPYRGPLKDTNANIRSILCEAQRLKCDVRTDLEMGIDWRSCWLLSSGALSVLGSFCCALRRGDEGYGERRMWELIHRTAP